MSEQEKLAVTVGNEGVVDTAATDLLMDLIGAGHSQTDHRVVSDHLRQYARHLAALTDQRDERGGEALREAKAAFATIYDKLCAYEGSWPTRDAREAKAKFYAALSTPATPEPTEAGEWRGIGWVYFNEDTGEEYATNHPIRSGEVSDATKIRPSTLMEDHLHAEWQAAVHQKILGEVEQAIASVAAQAIRSAFFTSVSGEKPHRYHLSLAYPTMEAMHAAEDAIKAWAKSVLEPDA